MNSATSIAYNGLQAFSTSLQVTAHNVANLNTADFRVSRTVLQENKGGGVSALVLPDEDSIDISEAAVSMITNSEGFKANLKLLKASDDVAKETLSMKA